MLVDSQLKLINGVKSDAKGRKIPWWGLQCKQIYSTGKTFTNTLFITEKKYLELKQSKLMEVDEK